jgi:deoxypyrimidine-specific 5' nucleotidase type C protein (NT5C)
MRDVNEEFRNGAGKPVVALDIDGTLGDYHGHFLAFAENYFGRPFPAPDKINPGKRLWEHMGIDLREYRDAKLAYRQGGFKRWMPAYEGADELTRTIRENGAEVWITTTRPYLRLDNIDPDTREWLRRNRIEYDAVLFGDNKYEELVRQVGLSRIVSVVDDLPECLSEAAGNGINQIWIRDQPYNRHFQPRWADRVDNLIDLMDYIIGHINDYSPGV